MTQNYNQTSGFEPWDLNNLQYYNTAGNLMGIGTPTQNTDFKRAISNILLQRTNMGSSLLTIQINDPKRAVLRDGLIKQGMTIALPGADGRTPALSYTLTQFVKASDQMQLIFESTGVYMLRNFGRGIKLTGGKGPQFVSSFMRRLVTEINQGPLKGKNQMGFHGPDFATTLNILRARDTKKTYYTPAVMNNIQSFLVGRGAGGGPSIDTNEDSWTCMSRIASSVGWRLWEYDNTIFFGPDEYWLGLLPGQDVNKPPVNLKYYDKTKATFPAYIPTLSEFTKEIQLIDFDWNVNKPLAAASVTVVLDAAAFNIGQVVQLSGVGIANGKWIVTQMQRNMFMPTMALGLSVPIPTGTLITPNSLPQAAFPLIAPPPVKPPLKKK